MGDNCSAAGINGKGGKGEDGFNAGMRGKKGSVYEGGHRVGCFVRWPARFKRGSKVEQLTAHRDWLPTLIELCGLKAPDGVKFAVRRIRDMQVTLLNLLGLDDNKLTYCRAGRYKQLSQLVGQVIKELIA